MLHVLRVFIGPDGSGGNPLGVFVEGSEIAPERRQAVAHDLDFSGRAELVDHHANGG